MTWKRRFFAFVDGYCANAMSWRAGIPIGEPGRYLTGVGRSGGAGGRETLPRRFFSMGFRSGGADSVGRLGTPGINLSETNGGYNGAIEAPG